MKNIHILPTDKPSRLWMTKLGNLTRCHDIKPIKEALGNNVNIYITSDEEIKEGDWLIVNDEDVMQMKSSYDNDMTGEDIWVGDSLNGYATYKDNCKKIILTTDQDLIKDGVQKIDDEFLEWFVNNQSCEFVDVYNDKSVGYEYDHYSIIIPKEEPKQEWSKSTGDLAVDYAIGQSKAIQKCMHLDAEMAYRSLPKQETFEEFAERLCPNKQVEYDMIIEGAKWQQERSYTEEEVLILLHERDVHNMHFPSTFNKGWKTPKEWFEQFKKK